MLIGLGIVLFFGSVYLLLSGLTVRQREIAISVRRARRYGTRSQREIETRLSVNDRILGPNAARLAGVTMKLAPKTNLENVSQKLLQAGMARSVTPQAYLAMKAGTAGGAILLGLMISITGGGTFGLVIALVGAAIGFIAPEFVINSRVRGRKDEMKTDLPNVLDLLSVCV